MAALLFIALLQSPQIDENSKFEVARRGIEREVARVHERIRLRERAIQDEPDDRKAATMRRELELYKQDVGGSLQHIWLEIEAMRLKELQRRPRDFVAGGRGLVGYSSYLA